MQTTPTAKITNITSCCIIDTFCIYFRIQWPQSRKEDITATLRSYIYGLNATFIRVKKNCKINSRPIHELLLVAPAPCAPKDVFETPDGSLCPITDRTFEFTERKLEIRQLGYKNRG